MFGEYEGTSMEVEDLEDLSDDEEDPFGRYEDVDEATQQKLAVTSSKKKGLVNRIKAWAETQSSPKLLDVISNLIIHKRVFGAEGFSRVVEVDFEIYDYNLSYLERREQQGHCEIWDLVEGECAQIPNQSCTLRVGDEVAFSFRQTNTKVEEQVSNAELLKKVFGPVKDDAVAVFLGFLCLLEDPEEEDAKTTVDPLFSVPASDDYFDKSLVPYITRVHGRASRRNSITSKSSSKNSTDSVRRPSQVGLIEK